LLPATLLWLAAVPSASAQDASNWDGQKHSAARLIAGATSRNHDASFLRAGIEIKLDPGWHTYWRDPGDSGAPPSFDFSGSENVKSVDVLWPAPVESNLVLSLGGDGAEDQAIARAEFRVPRPVALGQGAHADAIGERTQANTLASNQASAQYSAQATSDQGGAGKKSGRHGGALAILGVHRQPGDAHDRVLVDVEAPVGAAVDLFVEGPTPDWSLPLPQQGAADGLVRHFEFELDGLPPDTKAEGAALTLTAVSGDDAIEVTTHLD